MDIVRRHTRKSIPLFSLWGLIALFGVLCLFTLKSTSTPAVFSQARDAFGTLLAIGLIAFGIRCLRSPMSNQLLDWTLRVRGIALIIVGAFLLVIILTGALQ